LAAFVFGYISPHQKAAQKWQTINDTKRWFVSSHQLPFIIDRIFPPPHQTRLFRSNQQFSLIEKNHNNLTNWARTSRLKKKEKGSKFE
jgi:hypothetical protein